MTLRSLTSRAQSWMKLGRRSTAYCLSRPWKSALAVVASRLRLKDDVYQPLYRCPVIESCMTSSVISLLSIHRKVHPWKHAGTFPGPLHLTPTVPHFPPIHFAPSLFLYSLCNLALFYYIVTYRAIIFPQFIPECNADRIIARTYCR